MWIARVAVQVRSAGRPLHDGAKATTFTAPRIITATARINRFCRRGFGRGRCAARHGSNPLPVADKLHALDVDTGRVAAAVCLAYVNLAAVGRCSRLGDLAIGLVRNDEQCVAEIGAWRWHHDRDGLDAGLRHVETGSDDERASVGQRHVAAGVRVEPDHTLRWRGRCIWGVAKLRGSRDCLYLCDVCHDRWQREGQNL